MKKFLLCMMLAGLMMPVVAQERRAMEKRDVSVKEMADLGNSSYGMLPTTSRGTLLQVGGWKSAGASLSYDRQTQGSVYPMAKVHTDGFIGCTWTNEDNRDHPWPDKAFAYRGVGYSYSKDQGQTWSWSDPNNPEYQENRVSGLPLYWPSYAQWGRYGEVILARCGENYTYEYNGVEMEILNGLVLLTREVKGQGIWNINVVPYPEGYVPGGDGSDGAVLAWARMTTSGPEHEYIHIMSPMRTPVDGDSLDHPIYYYRTQDGGVTWDIEAEPIGLDGYTDNIDITARGNTVACSFIRWGTDAYLWKSTDNGDTWTLNKFFDIVLDAYQTPDDYDGAIYIPMTGGGIAIDKDGTVHLTFTVWLCENSEDDGYFGTYSGIGTTFLTYWNEGMGFINGDRDYNSDNIDELLWYGNCMDWEQSLPSENKYYVVSTVPENPIIGYPIPLNDENFVFIDSDVVSDWAIRSYGYSGCYTFSQIIFDRDDVLHLVYLGLLDGGNKGAYWLRQPFYTTTPDKGQTWTQTEYLINHVAYVDQEFAYLTIAGVHPAEKLFMMAQTDATPGTYQPYAPETVGEHSETTNNFTFFYITGVKPIDDVSISSIDYTPLTMELYPNPAAGQATVKFAGKGDITVYNMLGQSVYRIENVENRKDIPLNMASGVYFVTVRSGNATATQKLIVK